jgi:hypothetical protein
MGMMLNLLKKMDPEELFKIKTKANEIIANMAYENAKDTDNLLVTVGDQRST